jgi:hypothetical protein
MESEKNNISKFLIIHEKAENLLHVNKTFIINAKSTFNLKEHFPNAIIVGEYDDKEQATIAISKISSDIINPFEDITKRTEFAIKNNFPDIEEESEYGFIFVDHSQNHDLKCKQNFCCVPYDIFKQKFEILKLQIPSKEEIKKNKNEQIRVCFLE